MTRDDDGNYHLDGLIVINESHEDKEFPLGAVMLEELLHYVAISDRPESSADFSLEFLQFVLGLIVNELEKGPHSQKRAFQSMLIGHLWKLIEADTSGSRNKREA